jgi:hypothetical protein
LWDVLPLTTPSALLTGVGLGIRQALSIYLISWTLESLRRTRSVKNVKVVVYDQQLGGVEGEEVVDVIATAVVEAIVETEAVEQVDAATAVTSVGSSSALASGGKRASPRRKAVLRGEIDL